jgi:hypothetical protein
MHRSCQILSLWLLMCVIWSSDDEDINFRRFNEKKLLQSEPDPIGCGWVRPFPFLFFSGHRFLFPWVACAARPGAAAHICSAAPKGEKGKEGGREGLGFAAAAAVVIGTVRGACSFSRKKERLGSISYLGYSINLLILLLFVRALPCLA